LATAAGRAAVQKAIEAAALLFTWYSRQNRPDAIAVLSFPAYVYDPRKAQSAAGATDEAVPISVAQVTEDELKEVCKEYVNVQKFTNEAAEKARAMRNDWTRQRFGTEVHKRVACEVNGEDKTTRKCRTAADAENPNFRAEASVRKTLEADPNAKMRVDLEDGLRIMASAALSASMFSKSRRITTPSVFTTSKPAKRFYPLLASKRSLAPSGHTGRRSIKYSSWKLGHRRA
jgi:hypothetical protein